MTPELELGVGDDDPPRRGQLRALLVGRQADAPGLLGQLPPDQVDGCGKGDVLVVAGGRLGGRGEDRLGQPFRLAQAGGQRLRRAWSASAGIRPTPNRTGSPRTMHSIGSISARRTTMTRPSRSPIVAAGDGSGRDIQADQMARRQIRPAGPPRRR